MGFLEPCLVTSNHFVLSKSCLQPSFGLLQFSIKVRENGALTSLLISINFLFISGSPKLILVSPQDIYVYVRMDLYLEAQVEGYPYPWVSLSHDQHVLQNRSNFTSSNILLKVNSNITKANGGLYIICAGNPYRNHCLIMRVHVQDNQGGRECETTYKWTTYLLLVLVILLGGYLIRVLCNNRGANQIDIKEMG
ncbi:uncharacterized protein LOC111325537 [Stylophora pistillata]|uniref:uncharacterized protein LOC111325537 n=1 Tax=Stylophora pistillata TaxID=50429 RepID=UPI000C05496B|nr:uncharacterized protein LOC111325537 [Stylophora pistillata]